MAELDEKAIDRWVRDVAVTKLRSDGRTEKQIAGVLGIDQSTVNRILAKTIHGSYTFTPQLPDGMQMSELTSRMDDLMNKGDFRQTLRAISKNPLLMVDVAIHRKQHQQYSRDGFRPRTGQLISRLLDRSITGCGVTWGNEIRPWSTDIPGFVTRKPDKPPISFIPMCGINEGGPEALSRSSTLIAMRYNQLVNKGYSDNVQKPKLYNLNGLPVMHPVFSDQLDSNGTKECRDEIRKYVRNTNPDSNVIFGEQGDHSGRGLVYEVDTILTSVGGAGNHLLAHLNRWFPNQEKFELPHSIRKDPVSKQELCEEIAVGDIAGPLLPKPNKKLELNRKICHVINNNLATLKPEHLRHCHRRALRAHEKFQRVEGGINRVPPAAGVVAIVSGLRDKDAMLSALSEGYITRVIMDYELEKELIDRIKLYKGKGEPTLEQLLD